MTLPVNPTPAIFLPDNAPFTPEQRSWLNGFFAGLVALDSGAAVPLPDVAPGERDDGEAPWHDQTIPLPERMKLAEGRPLRRRMMAAMAQQDCGQCGYNCSDYADVLFAKKEPRLNLCVPGGKETARMLKRLYEELDQAPPVSAPPASGPALDAAPSEPGAMRDSPAMAVFLSRKRLNKPGSEKETWHIEFDLAGTGLRYGVGDSFGVFVRNDPVLVAQIIAALGVPPDFPIGARSLHAVLTDAVSLSPAPDALFQLMSYLTGGERRQKAKALSAGEDPDGDASTLDVLAALEKFPSCRPDPEAFIEALEPLQPRLYSISSSPRADAARLSLTVDAVRYRIAKRERLGVASTFLASRAKSGDRIPVYVQKAHGFALPADSSVPIVMIGPGTGVAPFRAFLQERMAIEAKGRNWLLFGHQRSAYDFFYEEELTAMKAAKLLTRLTLAWSRDGEQKIYVQDRMREVGRDLWAWLADGAHVYVCGDAKRMAKDVERALVDVVAQFGARSTDEAIAFVTGLKKAGRYQTDVY
jgi:sulfite reductase (NADPH) flavoprotein alpha-component